MEDNEPAFRECADAFIDHRYEQAANLALNLSEKHYYYWLAQLMLICLQRSQHFQHLGPMTDDARNAFSDHPWELSLLNLTANSATYQILKTEANTPKRQCQLNYYEGARLLTKGDRQGAVSFFQQASTIQAECMERIFADSELSHPESPDETLTRLLSFAAGSAKLSEFTSSADAIDLLIKQVPDTPFDPHCCIARSIEFLAELLHALPANSKSQAQLQQVSEILKRRGYIPGQCDRDFIKDLGGSIAFAAKAPLSRFYGLAKQVQTAGLTPLRRAALLFGFPLFLGRPRSFESPEHPAITGLREKGMPGSEGSPFCRRRFSGDASAPLSRSRYYAVCTDESGDDGQTLVSELNAYSAPLVTGYVVARTSVTSHLIEILFRGLPGDPNPFYIAVNDLERHAKFWEQFPSEGAELTKLLRSDEIKNSVPSENEFVVPICCSLEALRIERCLDLRLPRAREWMLRFYSWPPEGLFGKSLRILARAHQFDLREASTWASLLSVVNAPTYGGNPLTDLFGAFVRNIGIQALVYPSARNDYSSIVEQDKLAFQSGWNLVDYRDAPALGKVGIDIGNKISHRPGNYEIFEPTQGPQAGSVALTGNRLHTRLENERSISEYILLHGSEWGIRNTQTVLRARGYFWYSRAYSLFDSDEKLICGRCGATFTEEEVVHSINECPNCAYKGDV